MYKVPPSQILTASTGVIGAMLPMDIVTNGIRKTAPALGSAREDARLAAEAIMTTDTYSKEIAVEIELGGKTARIGGMCKGSGMITPIWRLCLPLLQRMRLSVKRCWTKR